MKFLSVLVASCVLASGAAFAQAPAGDAAAMKAAATELMEAMQFKQSVAQMSTSMSQSVPQMIERMVGNNPKLSAAEQAEAKKIAIAESDKAAKALTEIYKDPEVVKGMEEMMTSAYSRNFTLDEMKAMTAFYKTPAGKKAVTVMPQIVQESLPQVANLIAPRMNKLLQSRANDIVARVAKSDKTEPAKGEPRKEKATATN